jgi:8-oxo-dGTP pyrophosphatase MutT (NUDIX family)
VAIVHASQPDSVLLMRRAEHPDDPWSGHWSFPGGRCDAADATPLDTALRELGEECGITLARASLEAALPAMLARRRVGPFLLVAPFVFRVPVELPTVLDPQEAAEARWLPLALLRDPEHHRLSPVPGRPAEMLFPAVELNAAPLWGFTYRLIADWLGLAPPPDAAAAAAFQVAAAALDWLLSQGLTLEHGWTNGTAAVTGVIPVPLVLAHICEPARIPAVNAVEVRPDQIRIVGLAFEEYRIQARAARAG